MTSLPAISLGGSAKGVERSTAVSSAPYRIALHIYSLTCKARRDVSSKLQVPHDF